MMLYSLILVIFVTWRTAAGYDDLPCAARSYTNRSVVCVCTEDYCDTVIRETPESGKFYTYSSSTGGDRFNKSSGELEAYDETDTCDVTMVLDPAIKWQTMFGFGGAVTDTAVINWMSLNNTKLKQHYVNSYCSNEGLEYSMMRVPIGSSDFSARAYGYNMLPENDTTLSNFSLTTEDYDYKIPFIQSCMNVSNTNINIVASLWSPPPWMKTNNNYTGFSRLKPEYFQTLADYFYKFLEAYEAEGIPTWGVTLTNEPISGITAAFAPNSLGWTIDDMASWLVNNLGPTLRNSSSPFINVKIIANDDNRYVIPHYYSLLVRKHTATKTYIDGCAVHWYSDRNVPAGIMQKAMEKTPDKFLIHTESSIIPIEESRPPVIIDYGSWNRAERYITSIIENLNYNTTGWIDWNMAVSTTGGPSWIGAQLDAPVIIDSEAGEILKQPMFYAMGHFSKFIPQGSYRIQVNTTSINVPNVAFVTPLNTTVVVLYNAGEEKSVNIVMDSYKASITLGQKMVTTVEFPC